MTAPALQAHHYRLRSFQPARSPARAPVAQPLGDQEILDGDPARPLR